MKLATFALVALHSFTANAYMDQIPEWDSVEIQTVIDGDRVIVMAAISKERLTSLVVTMRGKRVVISPEEFNDLVRPRLNTLRIISPDVKSSSGPVVMVELKAEAESSSIGLPLGVARFHFSQFKYFGRDVSYSQVVHETKAPGQPPKRETVQSTKERKP